jgi:hypothetical protein
MSQTRIAISHECVSGSYRFALRLEIHRRLTADEASALRKQIADTTTKLQQELEQKLGEQ